MRKESKLNLTQEEKNEISKLLKQTSITNPRLHLRAKTILLKSEGKSVKDISKEIGLTRQSIHHIIKLYKKEGLAGVFPKKRGRKEKFSEDDKQKILNLVTQFMPSEFGIEKGYWTLRTIVKAMKKIYNLKISINTVRKILRDNNIDLKNIDKNRNKKIKLFERIKS